MRASEMSLMNCAGYSPVWALNRIVIMVQVPVLLNASVLSENI